MLSILNSKRTIVLDGSMGIRIQEHYPQLSVEEISVKDPDLVYSVHKDYVDSGAQIILTNTLGVHPTHYSARKVRSLIQKSVNLAKRAAKKGCLVAGDIGSSGRLPEPYGDYSIDEMIKDFSQVVKAHVDAGVDLIYLETFPSLIEIRAALIAAKKFKKPVYTTVIFDDSLRTTFADLPESCVLILEALGAAAAGVNCTTPEVVLAVLKKMRKVTSLPLIAKPNAGLPVNDGFNYDIKKMISFIPELTEAADLVGGCCGNGPDFIKEITKSRKVRKKGRVSLIPTIASAQRVVNIDHSILVGERINPTGRKKLTMALKKGDYQYVARQAKRQEDAGAEAVDINLFVPDLDEKENMDKVIKLLTTATTLPIFIDTKNYQAARRALTIYPGICVLNSVPVLKKELKRWLPLAADFGAYVVISLSGRKLPKTLKDRLNYYREAKRIAKELSFPAERLIYDPLVFPVASAPKQTKVMLKTVARLQRENELTILGISNVSYGMPNRSALNSTLVCAAIQNGASFLIVNPLDKIVKDSLLGAAIIFEERKVELQEKKEPKNLKEAIINGDLPLAKKLAIEKDGDPIKIINNTVIPGLDVVGDRYEKCEIFLPQLLASAEAAKAAMNILVKRIGKKRGEKGVVVLATVEGDVHDLGKNIVKVVLESYGYRVYDLGVNASKEKIIKTVIEKKAQVLGLSALMTTTMGKMAEVCDELSRRNVKVEVVVGGAPIDKSFARKIGAHYASDAVSGVKLINGLLNVPHKD